MAVKISFKKSVNYENPFPYRTLHERLVKDKAIDIFDNYVIEDLGSGHAVVIFAVTKACDQFKQPIKFYDSHFTRLLVTIFSTTLCKSSGL